MRGPCLCGDPYCSSCGPAQGNYKCPVCGKWSMDGGCDNPSKCEEESRKIDEERYRDYLIDEMWHRIAIEQNCDIIQASVPNG